jgi:TRAP-type C4-dicarboxylate transport system permease small subunit
MTEPPQDPVLPAPGGGPYPEQGQAATALVLGILSIVVCQLLGPVAWKLASDELRAIAEGRRPPDGQGLAQAGKVCGIVGTCFLALAVLFLAFSLVALLLGFGIFVTEATRS